MLLLLKNHKVKRKDDSKITEKDLLNSKYIMIDTSVNLSESSKNYVITDPSKIPKFTKAIVTYQLLFVYDDNEEGIADYYPIPPVKSEVESLASLIDLLNCIDRTYISNMMISNDEYLYVSEVVMIGYFDVILYNGSKKVYHKTYHNKSISDDEKTLKKLYGHHNLSYPLKAVKPFKDIYNTNIIHEMMSKNEFLYIFDDMTWKIGGIANDRSYLLIGVPLLGSRTISLLTDREFVRVMAIGGMSITCSIIFIINEANQRNINQMIREGMYEEVGETNHEYILISSLDFKRSVGGMPYNFVFLDILSHIDFSIRFTNMVYRFVQGFEDDVTDYGDGVDTIICIDIYDLYRKKNKEGGTRTLFMNEDTLIPLDKLLELI